MRCPISSAFLSTNRVCGFGPSAASTSSSTPSTMLSTRSTSPPKSACPGVSTMLTLVPPYSMAAFLARIVMPRSRSWSFESISRSSLSIEPEMACADCSIASTRDVLPWSTWATIAMLRMSERTPLPAGAAATAASDAEIWARPRERRPAARGRAAATAARAAGARAAAAWLPRATLWQRLSSISIHASPKEDRGYRGGKLEAGLACEA
mmetsp:Transcript_43264/g.139438  ORF Transcript_43264/g.139438 Transcript_43264/m.139438 type:complete len:209 (-) Transcript_43264:30-656(-)